MATLGLSKVFILDKYFTELQKFWETEKKLQDASSSNEAVHLHQRLKSLSSELVTLRNRLHVGNEQVEKTEANIAKNSTNRIHPTTPNLCDKDINKIINPNIRRSNANQVPHVHDSLIEENSLAHSKQTPICSKPSKFFMNVDGQNIVSETKNVRNILIPHPLPNQSTNVIDNAVSSNFSMPNTSPEKYQVDVAQHLHKKKQEEDIALDPSVAHINNKNYSLKTINAAIFSKRKPNLPNQLDDLIHLGGPLTEHAVLQTIQSRFATSHFFTNVGPILLSINPYLDVGNSLTLTSTRTLPLAPQLSKIIQEAVRQQSETGYPQAIILSGAVGSGKTHCSMLLLRQLFAVAGGGPETDAFKHLAAAFTVLRSLGSAKTTQNSESSRIGQFIEVQVTDGALYRTKIHCYFLDQSRVVKQLPKEKNYHIFYQMLSGLNPEERSKLNLEGYSPSNLKYLQKGDIIQNSIEDANRFQAWKTCLSILGIPFLDVVRVLAAVLLLGNVQFFDGQGVEVNVKGETELNSVASLLGVPPAGLFRGLTTRSHNARGQIIKSLCDANISNMTRDSLAKALYCRTVATIVRRANSLKRLGSTLGTLSSDSNESVHNQGDMASHHTSMQVGNSGSKSMAALNNAVRHATDGFIGILDMFGFEEPNQHAHLEHLCINLCAETMQHFYNTHIFKSSVESCRDEGIVCDIEIDYIDNVPCIDLISSLRTGLLSMLDAECSVRGIAESYVSKIKTQHKNSSRLEYKHSTDPLDTRSFLIKHFAGRVEYDATGFLETNRDVVTDDTVAVFHKHTCNFGFASHLFGSELKALYSAQPAPRGLSFRISPTSHTDLLNGDEPISTLTQDFHTRLDNLLRTLVHARPHFVRCVRSNSMEKSLYFDRSVVAMQIRSLQVLETVNLMASGFPHRMRFKQFNARYRMLAPFRAMSRTEEKAVDDCTIIIQSALKSLAPQNYTVSLAWAPGKRHVFMSEGIRQHLENLRSEFRDNSARLIQAQWRKYWYCKKMKFLKNTENFFSGIKYEQRAGYNENPECQTSLKKNISCKFTRPRPQPISGTPPPDPIEKCDSKIIQQTCSLFGLDMERAPPVPPSRDYLINGDMKLKYPQSRIMKMNFPDDPLASPATEQLLKGETVCVVGASTCRGHLIVDHNGQVYNVPFHYMELVTSTFSNDNKANGSKLSFCVNKSKNKNICKSLVKY